MKQNSPCLKLYRNGSLLKSVMFAALTIFLFANLPIAQNVDEEASRSQFLNMPMPVKSEDIPLDRPIDPAVYKLGPGDQLAIFIWGTTQGQYNLTISPEGKLLIPSVGPVMVAGAFLADAKNLIKDEVLKRFKNIEVNAELVSLRQFKVAVGGDVQFPGMYTANAVTRVSEAINLAGGFKEYVPVSETGDVETINPFEPKVFPEGTSSHRNILIKHIDGSIDTADVLMFELLGKLKHNYRLTDGDEILVPLRDEKINLYGIFGGVINPAFYEYSPRDSLSDLIELAHGLTLDSDYSVAELVRFADDGSTLIRRTIELTGILAGRLPDIHLLPDDRVFIKSVKDYNVKHQILILGEVNNPGFYAILPDSSKLTDVLNQAGGFTGLASLAEAQMTRSSEQNIVDPEFERLRLMEVSDMDELEYEYFKIKSRENPGRISVDFTKLGSDKSNIDIKLRDGDIINIPRISEVINVSGKVSNPGLLTYHANYNFKDYIEQAGGFSFRADKGAVRIIKGVSGEWKKAKQKTALSPGDIILVPEKKKSRFFYNLKEVMAFTANTAAVFLIIREATK